VSTRSSSSTALPNPSSDLFGLSGRRLLERLQLPQPWASTATASLALIDTLDEQINRCERELRTLGADHRYVPLLLSCPGIGWILAFTIASEIGDIHRFPTPGKLAGYTGLCPRVQQSGDPARPAAQERPQPPALGARRSRRTRPPAIPATARSRSACAPATGKSAAPRSPRSRSHAASPKRSGHMLTTQQTLRPGRRPRVLGRLTAPN